MFDFVALLLVTMLALVLPDDEAELDPEDTEDDAVEVIVSAPSPYEMS